MKRKKAIKLYFANALLYGCGVLLFYFLPYYQRHLSQQTKLTLLYLYIAYLLFSPLYYILFATKYTENKALLIWRSMRKVATRKKLQLAQEEKVAWLFLLVKLFFIPLMLQFFVENIEYLSYNLQAITWYPLALALIFTLDTGIFTFGYLFEARQLNNVVRSVEPTLFGWIVALISYPPFNSFVGRYVTWGANDYVAFWNPTLTIVMQVIIVILFSIYLFATFALGTKASNLTNRGIVTKFPYSVIRHPAYICKMTVWWLTLLPVMSWTFAFGMVFWTVIYFFRAVTEERHLLQDQDYKQYCKKVKWKFIPGIF
jgi:protein-S-isoprenylcysteine O-methyltransferase Ste14